MVEFHRTNEDVYDLIVMKISFFILFVYEHSFDFDGHMIHQLPNRNPRINIIDWNIDVKLNRFTFPGSFVLLWSLLKHLFNDKLCRIEFYNHQIKVFFYK